MDGLDRFGRLAMQRHLAGAGERLVERGPDNRVREAEPGGRYLGHEPGGGRLLDRAEHGLFAQVPGHAHHAQFELRPDHGRDPQRLVGLAG